MGRSAGGNFLQNSAGYVLVSAAATLWGCWALFLRPAGLTGVSSAFVLFLVMSLPGPLVAFRRWTRVDRGAMWSLLVHGVCDAINVWLYFEAVKRGPLAVAVLTHYLTPLLVALIAPVMGERRSKRALLAAPLSLVGLVMLIGIPGGEGFPAATAAFGAASAVFYAALLFAAKRASRSFSGFQVTVLHSPVACAVLLAGFGGKVWPSPGSAWGWAAVGACICGLLATTMFNEGLRRIPAQAASALTYLEPLVATGVGWAVLGERLTALSLVGAVLVLACGAWVVTEPSPPAAAPAPAFPPA